MANYLESQNFEGMAHWFRLQAKEEKRHALKINDFLMERNVVPDLGKIKPTENKWRDAAAVLDEAHRHECMVSNMIYDLVAQAMDDKDFASLSFLQWFVDEQVEEEAQSSELLNKARLIDGDIAGLMSLDSLMGARTE